MLKKIVLLILVASCLCAAPTSKPAIFDGHEYALAVAGIYRPEDRLLKEAVAPSTQPQTRAFAMIAAIVNEWRGPFRVHEFGVWVRKNGLAGRIRAAPAAEMGNAPGFTHLPDGFSQVSLQMIDAPDGDPIEEIIMAVPDKVSAEDVQAILDDPKDGGTGQAPVAYALEVFSFPSGFPD